MSQNQDDVQVKTSITIKAPKAVEKGRKPEDWSITFESPILGMDLAEMAQTLGEAKLTELAKAQYKISFQQAVRGLAERGESDEAITEIMTNWKPGDVLRSDQPRDPLSAAMRNYGNMSPEQKAAFIKMLEENS